MVTNSAAAVKHLAHTAPGRILAIAPQLAPARDFGRVVHFIDIENLCGTSDVRIHAARNAMLKYHEAVNIAAGDHVIIGASHHNAVAAWNAWPSARLLTPRSGPDGADRALREAMHTERIPERFTDIYLGSGDGGFAEDLAYLADAGSTTNVVARTGHMSGRLRLAAHHVITITTTIYV